MKNIIKILMPNLAMAMLMANIAFINPSIGMDIKPEDHSPKSERGKHLLANMLYGEGLLEFTDNTVKKAVAINHALEFSILGFCRDIRWEIATLYYHLHMNEFYNATYVVTNKQFLRAINDKIKRIVVFEDCCSLLWDSNLESEESQESDLKERPEMIEFDEILILSKSRCFMPFNDVTSISIHFSFVIELFLKHCSVKTIKMDPLIINKSFNTMLAQYASSTIDIYGNIPNSLYRKISIKPHSQYQDEGVMGIVMSAVSWLFGTSHK